MLFYQFEKWDLRDIRQASSYNLCSDMRCNFLEFAAILSHLDVFFSPFVDSFAIENMIYRSRCNGH
jgi:hypothetical protein